MNEETTAALLGRPLSTLETTNFKLYMKIAKMKLDELLCMNLCSPEDSKVFAHRCGYTTVFTDVFSDIQEVSVNGEVVDPANYTVYQWDRAYGNWFNSVVFDTAPLYDVTVTASWGFAGGYPADLQLVLAQLFANTSSGYQSNDKVQSKKVEDFSINFQQANGTADENLSDANRMTLSKYSLCSLQTIRQGKVGTNCGCWLV